MHLKLLRGDLEADLKAIWVVFGEGAGWSTLHVGLVRKLNDAIEVFVESIARRPDGVVQVV